MPLSPKQIRYLFATGAFKSEPKGATTKKFVGKAQRKFTPLPKTFENVISQEDLNRVKKILDEGLRASIDNMTPTGELGTP